MILPRASTYLNPALELAVDGISQPTDINLFTGKSNLQYHAVRNLAVKNLDLTKSCNLILENISVYMSFLRMFDPLQAYSNRQSGLIP